MDDKIYLNKDHKTNNFAYKLSKVVERDLKLFDNFKKFLEDNISLLEDEILNEYYHSTNTFVNVFANSDRTICELHRQFNIIPIYLTILKKFIKRHDGYDFLYNIVRSSDIIVYENYKFDRFNTNSVLINILIGKIYSMLDGFTYNSYNSKTSYNTQYDDEKKQIVIKLRVSQ